MPAMRNTGINAFAVLLNHFFDLIMKIINRFETLQRTTSLRIQPLLFPQRLHLSSAHEQILLQYLSVFEANGFRLSYQEEQPIGQRFQLWTKPFYKEIEFHQQDIHELASLLSEGYGEDVLDRRLSKDYLLIKNQQVAAANTVSPPPQSSSNANHNNNNIGTPPTILLPRLMATYASKACRTAVMIGMGLEKRKMEEIVSQLTEIEQPWNCPHGRPTLRHLLDLKELSSLLSSD